MAASAKGRSDADLRGATGVVAVRDLFYEAWVEWKRAAAGASRAQEVAAVRRRSAEAAEAEAQEASAVETAAWKKLEELRSGLWRSP